MKFITKTGFSLLITVAIASIPLIQAVSAQSSQLNTRQKTWNKAQLLHQLDLYSLYPSDSRNCKLSPVSQAISPNSRFLAISSHDYERSCGSGTSTLTLWDLPTGKKVATLIQGKATEAFWLERNLAQEPVEGNTYIAGDIAHAVAFTPNNNQIIAGLSNGTVKVWDVKTGQIAQTLQGHRYAVHAIALSPNGQLLASGSSDQTVKLWDLQTGKPLHTFNLNPSNGIIDRLIMSSDGQTLVSATTTNKIQLWNSQTGQLKKTLFNSDRSPGSYHPIALSPNGQLLATSDKDNSIKLWNLRTGSRFLTLKGHTDKVQSLAFSPNGKSLVSSSNDNTIKFWNLPTNKLEHILTNIGVTNPHFSQPSINRIVFSPNGQTLAIEALMPTSNPVPLMGIKLWDIQQQKIVFEAPETFSLPGVQFSLDGQLLVAVAPQTKIWQASN
ncbi:WD40 repeat domain-containing protein [Trichocoleus sp. DQ-U1]|uniref:WD40 repeat domain-containing protein n=1 Tax=Trichocoleus sp. DQ-U1 TaxID=2933926 RepID=UPI0032973FC2